MAKATAFPSTLLTKCRTNAAENKQRLQCLSLKYYLKKLEEMQYSNAIPRLRAGHARIRANCGWSAASCEAMIEIHTKLSELDSIS